MVGFATVGAYFYTQAGKKQPVVVVVNNIPAGHIIQRSDLSTVDVAGAVTAVGGAGLDSVIGETAVVELLPRTLLQRAMVTSAPTLHRDQAQVGVAVRPGQIPAAGLRPGDTVDILQLPPKDTASRGSAKAVVLAAAARVYDTAIDPSQSGGTLLTVLVAKSAATGIASASNAGLIALVRVGK
jgi:hypothetical protein